jgi:hypothetical protein
MLNTSDPAGLGGAVLGSALLGMLAHQTDGHAASQPARLRAGSVRLAKCP